MPLTKHPRKQYIYHPYPTKADLSTFYEIVSDKKDITASSGNNIISFSSPGSDEIHTITHIMGRNTDSSVNATQFRINHNGTDVIISQKLNPDINETFELIYPFVLNKDCYLKIVFMQCDSGDDLRTSIFGYKTLTYY